MALAWCVRRVRFAIRYGNESWIRPHFCAACKNKLDRNGFKPAPAHHPTPQTANHNSTMPDTTRGPRMVSSMV
eukprot:4520955-Lingulodinium_polyedra.AAC.1